MATRVGGLFISLALDMAQFDEGMTTAERKVSTLNKLTKEIDGSMSRGARVARKLASEMAALAGAGNPFGSVIANISRTLIDSTHRAGELIAKAKALGIEMSLAAKSTLALGVAFRELFSRTNIYLALLLAIVETFRLWRRESEAEAEAEYRRRKEANRDITSEITARLEHSRAERMGELSDWQKFIDDIKNHRIEGAQIAARFEQEIEKQKLKKQQDALNEQQAQEKKALDEAARYRAWVIETSYKREQREKAEADEEAKKHMEDSVSSMKEAWAAAVRFGKEHLKAWRDARDVARSMTDLIVGRGQGVWGGMLAAVGAGRTAAGPSDAAIQGIATQWAAQGPQQVGFGEMVALLRSIWEEEKRANQVQYRIN
jgi:hypothetical protein